MKLMGRYFEFEFLIMVLHCEGHNIITGTIISTNKRKRLKTAHILS